MPIVVACPNCGAKYKLNDSMGGKRVRCQKCSGAISVPAAAEDGIGLMPDGPARSAAPTRSPVAAKPAARPSAPARPVKRPAPRDEGEYDLAALENEAAYVAPQDAAAIPAMVQQAPMIQPPMRPQMGRPQMARPLGYAAPATQAELEVPEWVYKWSPMLFSAVFWGGVIQAVIRGVALRSGGLVGAMLCGSTVGIVMNCVIIAPLILLGLWLTSKMMSFDLGEGAYKKTITLLGIPAIVGIITALFDAAGLSPAVTIILAIVGLGISLCGMAKLMKDSFVLTWVQTLVAGLMSFVFVAIGVIGIVLFFALVVGFSIGALGNFGKIAPGAGGSGGPGRPAPAPIVVPD